MNGHFVRETLKFEDRKEVPYSQMGFGAGTSFTYIVYEP